MKTIFKIILILTALISISCDNMYNDIAVEIVEYDYYLAVAQNVAAGQTQIYSIDPTSMILNQKSSLNNAPTMTVPIIASHPTGKYLFIPFFSGTGWLGSYKIKDDVSLSLINNFGLPGIISVVVHPTGNYLYCAYGSGTDVIAEYSIDESGKLTAIGSNQALPSGQNRMAISPTGNFLYAGGSSSGSMIYIFPINSDGTLSTPSTTVAIGGSPSIASIKTSKNGSLYCTTSSTGIYLYNKTTNILVSQGSYGGGTSGFIAFHPSGNYLYVSGGTSCYLYKINGDNTLTYVSPYATPVTINEILVHPNGNIMFITGTNTIYSYSINSSGAIQSQLQSISSSSADGLALIRKRKL